MEEIYVNVDPVNNAWQIPVRKNEGPGSSKKKLYVGVIIFLGLLNVLMLIGLISLGVFSHDVSSLAADLIDTKDNLTDRLQSSNNQLSAMTKERDQLNAALLERSNEVTRLQSLSKKTCPDGWRMFSFSCYLLITEKGSWNKARLDCRNKGGDLVVINNNDEQRFILTISVNSPWIGLSEETEGSWKWVDGTALSSELKKFWGRGQPDNAGGNENCGQIWGNLKAWNDHRCKSSFPWICEKAPIYLKSSYLLHLLYWLLSMLMMALESFEWMILC